MLIKYRKLFTKILFWVSGLLSLGMGISSFKDGSLQFKGIDGRLVFGPFAILAGLLLIGSTFKKSNNRRKQ